MSKFKVFVIILLIQFSCIQFSNKHNSIKFWTISLSPLYDEYITELIDNFYEETGIIVEWIDQPYSMIMSKLDQVYWSDDMPDVINLNTPWLKESVDKRYILDLTNELTVNNKGVYLPNVINSCIYNNKLYQVPWYFSPSVLVYNKEILNYCNIEIDESNINWPYLYQLQSEITEKTHLYGIGPTINILDELVLNDIPVINIDKKELLFNNNDTIRLLETYKYLYNSEIMPKSLQGYMEYKYTYANGKLQLLPVGLSILKMIEAYKIDIMESTDITFYPRTEKNMIKISPMNIQVSQYTSNKEQQIQFALYLTNARNQINFQKVASIVPSTIINILNDDYFELNKDKNIYVKGQIMTYLSHDYFVDVHSKLNINQTLYSKINKILQNYSYRQIKGEYSIREALNIQEKECYKLLQYF